MLPFTGFHYTVLYYYLLTYKPGGNEPSCCQSLTFVTLGKMKMLILGVLCLCPKFNLSFCSMKKNKPVGNVGIKDSFIRSSCRIVFYIVATVVRFR
jgi:hypothetical protein